MNMTVDTTNPVGMPVDYSSVTKQRVGITIHEVILRTSAQILLISLTVFGCLLSGCARNPASTALPVATEVPASNQGSAGFTLSSPAVAQDGALPAEYTCDGASATLALNWSGAPKGTKGYAVIMHHVASQDDVHWYWVLYDIPQDATGLSKNSTATGTLGTNSVNDKTAYAPPCSKGPGPKVYTYTVYALSAQPQLSVPASQVNRDVLLDAIRDITLASAELHVIYTRK
jgi:phosphatidylethanolamine-binding protein (PEBP) family uncharacterized protein